MPANSFGQKQIIINEAEYSLMLESAESGRVYAWFVYMYLRWHMDYGTGIVGVRRGISYQALREHLERRPDRGSRWGIKEVSKSFVREQIRWLIGKGYLERHGGDSKLVFRLVSATWQQSVSTRNSTGGNTPFSDRPRGKAGHLSIVPTTEQPHEQHTSSKYLSSSSPERVFAQQVADLYNEQLAGKAGWKRCALVGPRLVRLVAGVMALGDKYDLDWFGNYFAKIQTVDYLMGRAGRGRDTFTNGLPFLLNQEKMEKIINGEFD